MKSQKSPKKSETREYAYMREWRQIEKKKSKNSCGRCMNPSWGIVFWRMYIFLRLLVHLRNTMVILL
jgi:hypothetical protein